MTKVNTTLGSMALDSALVRHYVSLSLNAHQIILHNELVKEKKLAKANHQLDKASYQLTKS